MMKKILVIAGPTAVGKTKYALDLAKTFDGEIVSCDSMQLYKFMDIGSAKPTKSELAQVKHYLIGEVDPREVFSVAKYQQLAKKAIQEVHKKGKLPIIAGGTGLYLNALLYDMDFSTPPRQDDYRKTLEQEESQTLHARLLKSDPEAAARIHPNNKKKLIRALEAVETTGEGIKPFEKVKTPTEDYVPLLLCLTRDRPELYERINQRVELLIDAGLIDEVSGLLRMGLTEDHISMKGIGYKEVISYLNGTYDLETAIKKIQQNTRNYAKRQLTWFRRYDKMRWFNLSEYEVESRALEDIVSWVRENK